MELGFWVGGLGKFFGVVFGVEGEVGVPLFGEGEALDGFGEDAFAGLGFALGNERLG
jgi:hypothetical protein